MDHTTVIVVVNHPKCIQKRFVSSECKEVLIWKNYNAGCKWIQYVPAFKTETYCKGTATLRTLLNTNLVNGKFLPFDLALFHGFESLSYNESPSDAVAYEYKHLQELAQLS
jgi:hypothetical protein